MEDLPSPKERKALIGARQKVLRTGIVGAGYIADFHATAIRNLENVELVSVCDQNMDSARIFAERCGVPKVYQSLTSMLQNEQLDAIHILVPPDQHYPTANCALAA